MLLLLPCALGLLWLLVATRRAAIGFANLSVRGALVLAYLAFELLVLLITELTSIGHHFTRGAVVASWALVVVALLVATRKTIAGGVGRATRDGGWRGRVGARITDLSIEEGIWMGVVVVMFAILVVVGALYLPSNPDSLVYHLARVEHWIQNRTVAPYASHYLAQIEFAPLAEYNLAHLHLLSGTDRFDAAMSLLAALVSIVGVSELARLLGGTRWVQIVAAVVCATIPSGVLLATSTENNYFGATIALGLLIVLLSLSVDRGRQPRAIALGVAAGLAYLSKGTIPVMISVAAVLLVAILIYRQARHHGREVAVPRLLGAGATAAICVVAVAGPFVAQNVELFGSPNGPVSESSISKPLTVNVAAANFVRSVSNNFQIGNGVAGLQFYVSKITLDALHRTYDLFGVAQGDPRYNATTPQQAFKVQDNTNFDRSEDLGANPWHVILIVASIVVLVVAVVRGARELRIALLLAVGLAAGYLLFTGTVRWGVYGTRYALPLLVAWCPLIAARVVQVPAMGDALCHDGLGRRGPTPAPRQFHASAGPSDPAERLLPCSVLRGVL